MSPDTPPPGKTFLVNPKYSGNLENYWETKGKKVDILAALKVRRFLNLTI
ncbi:hypothetical protein MYAER_3048 [Microcystis aeruginosa NIES-2549]|uniref:Uncharacterized protein n=1 Tax=Microcystis aeruginosa NIES-2549 TaxID=1641812 RepID=A0A0F6RMM9_MICAE|nr:hypothetical protein MYAER_3048 [Microcystis aeruginosa NIES-2549]AOC53798.1 hypothetical protein amyaer_3091 [Microcystis aeruginosa NIES-2481]